MGIYREDPKKKPVVEGHALLKALVDARGLAIVAKKSGAEVKTVQMWLCRKRRPGTDARLALWRHFEIPLAAWDKPEKEVEKPRKVSDGPPRPPKAFDRQAPGKVLYIDTLARAHDAVGRSAIEELNALDKYSRMVARYAELQGELNVSQEMILRSTFWDRVIRKVEEALGPYPDAARAVAKALEDLEGGSE